MWINVKCVTIQKFIIMVQDVMELVNENENFIEISTEKTMEKRNARKYFTMTNKLQVVNNNYLEM